MVSVRIKLRSLVTFCLCVEGPMVDKNMSFTLLSSRANESDVMFTLNFNVSFGPPSMIRCVDGSNTLLFVPRVSRSTGISELSREVIRSHYINSSHPDMTRVTLTQTSPRQPITYTCTVTVEGRVNIDKSNYNFANKGSGNTTASITGECVTAVLNSTAHYYNSPPPPPPPPPPLSCRHPHWCHCSQDWIHQCQCLLDCSINRNTTSWL